LGETLHATGYTERHYSIVKSVVFRVGREGEDERVREGEGRKVCCAGCGEVGGYATDLIQASDRRDRVITQVSIPLAPQERLNDPCPSFIDRMSCDAKTVRDE
jgi:hypothetical protein